MRDIMFTKAKKIIEDTPDEGIVLFVNTNRIITPQIDVNFVRENNVYVRILCIEALTNHLCSKI